MVFEKIKKMMRKRDENSPDFIEIDLEAEKPQSKVLIKTFILRSYDDINSILNALREGYTIAVIDIKQLKAKDIVELKRVISKVKKTIDALGGSIAGFGENVIIATPSFARIQKGASEEKSKFSGESERF